MSSKSAFVELKIDQLPENYGNLLQVLESLMPNSVQMINLINLKMKQMFSPEMIPSFQFFSYGEEDKGTLSNRDWSDTSKPLFLVCKIITKYTMVEGPNCTYNFMYSRESPSSQDITLMEKFSGLFDFSRNSVSPSSAIFGAVDKRYIPFLEKISSSHERKTTVYPNWAMYLRKEKATEFSDDDVQNYSSRLFSIRPLQTDHASIVNSHWKFGRNDGTMVHLRDQIQHSVSAGVFVKGEDHDQEELACWGISMPSGTINALHTRDHFRRKGYAALVMKNISLNLARHDLFPLVEIEYESSASKSLMEKLGFELAFEAAWVYCQIE